MEYSKGSLCTKYVREVSEVLFEISMTYGGNGCGSPNRKSRRPLLGEWDDVRMRTLLPLEDESGRRRWPTLRHDGHRLRKVVGNATDRGRRGGMRKRG